MAWFTSHQLGLTSRLAGDANHGIQLVARVTCLYVPDTSFQSPSTHLEICFVVLGAAIAHFDALSWRIG